MVRAVYPHLDPILRGLSGGRLYSAYQLPEEDLIATGLEEDPRPALKEAGYNPARVLSARKEHPRGGLYDVGSYRRIPHARPVKATTKEIAEWEPRQCQFHVHVWKRDGKWDVACHYELRSSLFRPNFNVERLKTHYDPEWGEQKVLGVNDPIFFHMDDIDF